MADCTCADPQAVASAIKNFDSQTKDSAEAIHQTLYGKSLGTVQTAGGSASASATKTGDPAGQPGALGPIRFCQWVPREVSGSSDVVWNTIMTLASTAIAALNAMIQGKIADLQQDLAEGYYQMAKFKWDRFKDNYMPFEKEMLIEVSSEPVREMDCADDRQRAEQAVNSAFSQVSSAMKQKAKMMRCCLDPSVVSLLEFRRVRMLVDTENYNIIDDRWFTDYKNDDRWNKRGTMLNLGRNISSQALSYGGVARTLANKVGGQVEAGLGSLMTSIGYFGARNDTVYPTTMMGTNGGMGSSLVSTTVNPASLNVSGY